jgi:hypothetical protein
MSRAPRLLCTLVLTRPRAIAPPPIPFYEVRLATTLHDDLQAIFAAQTNVGTLAAKFVANLKTVAPNGTAGVPNADNSIHLIHVDASAPLGFTSEDVPSLLTTSPTA